MRLSMILCKCACAHLIWKANFNLISKTGLFMSFYIGFQITFQNFISNSTGQKNIAMFRVYGQNFCSILYMDSYFFSLILKWVMYMYLQVRKFADRSLIYRLQISFYLNLRPFQDYFIHIETGQLVGGPKK